MYFAVNAHEIKQCNHYAFFPYRIKVIENNTNKLD